MQRIQLLLATAITGVLMATPCWASLFGGGGSSLQHRFNQLGYDHINVANYQTDLNLKLQGMMEFQMLGKTNNLRLSFGMLEIQDRRWGKQYRHRRVFGTNAKLGATKRVEFNDPRDTYGFYVTRHRNNGHNRTFYSNSRFNRGGATQVLFYQDPINSNTYLLAWEGLSRHSSHSDRRYDDLVVRMTINPAPEPTTWMLFATGMIALGVFGYTRRRTNE